MLLLQSALVALSATLAVAVTPLEVRGNAFVNPKTGTKFQMVGVAYQPGGSSGYNPELGSDPLSHGDICRRDAALMQMLGINAIRVYNLNPNLNHDECASIFNAAGMYMLLDVNSPLPGEALHTAEPWTTYYDGYLNRTFAVVEAFKNYPNTLLFFSGNEVIQKVESAKFVPPYLRAVTRDLRNYIAKHSSRPIPVGYSAADVREVLLDTWNYLQCAEDGDVNDRSRVEIFGLNSYSWCGDSDFDKSTYDDLVAGLKSTSVPVFFSEYGCNEPAPRIFTEVGTLYGSQMMPVFSGGLVYEYSEEPHHYGLVQINSDDSVKILPDFHTLAAQYNKLDFTAVESGKPDSTMPKPPTCSSSLIKQSGFNNNFTVPDLPPGGQKLIDDGISPKPSGKIIPISDYSFKFKVLDVDGTELTNLAVKPLGNDESNRPGTNTGGGRSGSPASPTPTEKPNAGVAVGPALLMALGLPLAALLLV